MSSRDASTPLDQPVRSPETARHLWIPLRDLPVVTYDWSLSKDCFIRVSENVRDLIGWSAEELLIPGLWRDLVHPEDREQAKAVCDDLSTMGVEHLQQYRVRTRHGAYRRLRIIALPFDSPDPFFRVKGLITLATPLLLEPEGAFGPTAGAEAAVALGSDAFWWLDLVDEQRSFVSSGDCGFVHGLPTGFRPTLRNLLELVHPDDRANCMKAVESVIANSAVIDFRHRLSARAGEAPRWVHHRGSAIRDATGEVRYLAGSTRDVTGEAQAVARLEAQLAAKRLLLRELNHRAKNNLQLVSSLLALHAENVSSLETRRLLERTAGQVKALLDLNKHLGHAAAGLPRIELGAYLRELIGETRRAAAEPGDALDVEVGCDLGTLAPDIAASIGLMINELLTNALKHARRPGQALRIELSAERTAGKLAIRVADNGTERAEDEPAGFGTRLLAILADQLGADLRHAQGLTGRSVSLLIPLAGADG